MSRELRRALAALDGVVESESAFKDDVGYWVNGKEIAHFEGERAIDIRLTRAVIRDRRAELKADPRVRLRASGSDWLTVELTEAFADPVAVADPVAFAVELVAAAAAAHRAAPGTIAAAPPDGADLERRRRFH
jgi:Family of unknown function (DUF5519)